MVYDQQMIEALSEVLQEGETFFHPVFAMVKQGSLQQVAYLAFTENHFLIAYLTTGNRITYVERIPLEIKSIKINKTKIFNEHKIHILFENKKSYELSVFPKVLKIKSQKENFPLFLEHLKSNAKKQAKSLEAIEGKKIRWQYFNTYIYMMLAIIPVIPIMIIMGELRKGNFDIWNVIVEMSGSIPALAAVYGIFIGPFIILSIFNRLSFGKILGVVTENTLFLENREIPIADIMKIVYHPRFMSRHKVSFSSATIFVRVKANEMEALDVLHFPLYGLRKIKKYNKKIKLSCDNNIWFLIFAPTVIAVIMGLLLFFR